MPRLKWTLVQSYSYFMDTKIQIEKSTILRPTVITTKIRYQILTYYFLLSNIKLWLFVNKTDPQLAVHCRLTFKKIPFIYLVWLEYNVQAVYCIKISESFFVNVLFVDGPQVFPKSSWDFVIQCFPQLLLSNLSPTVHVKSHRWSEMRSHCSRGHIKRSIVTSGGHQSQSVPWQTQDRCT